MSKKPVRLFNGIPMTADRLRTLQELAKCGESGAAHVRGVLEGAHMATLVAMGLAERVAVAARDRAGGCRYRAILPGLELAGVADASAARTGGLE